MTNSNPNRSPGPAELSHALELTDRHRRRQWLTKVIAGVLTAAAIAAGYAYLNRPRTVPGPEYETAEVTRGELHVTVTATGTLSARDSVDVGAEISGRVVRVHVDFNDKVKQGQVLAEIDPAQYRAKRDDATAQLALARASKLTAQATASEAELKAKRLRAMNESGLSTLQEVEAAEAALARAHASIQSSEAQITSAGASLKVAATNLDKTRITSPIDGVVLARSVEPGQTVTSGLQTPVLFTLAADLAEMLLAVKVDEADVGQVKAGQRATFTVDAYPNRTFDSVVVAVKNMPTTTQNVVTYETRLLVKNAEGLLRPGMTATATIIVDDQKDVLLVPNAALRFTPKSKASSQPSASAQSQGFSISRIMPRPPGMRRAAGQPSVAKAKPTKRPTVYILSGKSAEKVVVEIGATDGVSTAVSAPQLAPGSKVIISEAAASDG